MWESFLTFLKEMDVRAIAQWIRQLDWTQLLTNPLFWLGLLTFLAWVVWKKRYKVLILLVSVMAFMALLQHSLPPPGAERIEFFALLQFLGGAVVIIGLNLYLFFIKGD